jgi:hypothetical protein
MKNNGRRASPALENAQRPSPVDLRCPAREPTDTTADPPRWHPAPRATPTTTTCPPRPGTPPPADPRDGPHAAPRTLRVEHQHRPGQPGPQPGHRLLPCPRQRPALQCPPQLTRQQVAGLSDRPRRANRSHPPAMPPTSQADLLPGPGPSPTGSSRCSTTTAMPSQPHPGRTHRRGPITPHLQRMITRSAARELRQQHRPPETSPPWRQIDQPRQWAVRFMRYCRRRGGRIGRP